MSERKIGAYWEKLLPNQPFNMSDYCNPAPIEQSLFNEIMRTSRLTLPIERFKISKTEKFTIEEMASNPVVLGFLNWIIRLQGYTCVLEIGTFVGVSAMSFAESLPADGRVVTIEKFDHFADVARRNFRDNNLTSKIELIEGDAETTLSAVAKFQPFDLVFIDGNKENYDSYFMTVQKMTSKNGIIVIDDAFFHGDVVNDRPTTPKGEGVRRALDLVANSTAWNGILLPISNGILLLQRAK